MEVKIYQSKASGVVDLPTSKSDAHRLIIASSLANGKSVISNVSFSLDIKATIELMRNLGAKIDVCEESRVVIIEGIKDFKHFNSLECYCHESGSTLRFLIPLFTLTNKKVTFKGKPSLFKRPLKVYEEIFDKLGINYEHGSDYFSFEGKLKSGYYLVDGNVSSQFISGLLFTLPLLEEESVIEVKEPFESKSYVKMTLKTLEEYNIKVKVSGNKFYIPGNQKYLPKDNSVEADYSQLAFYLQLGALNNDLKIKSYNPHTLQGDVKVIEMLRSLNVPIKIEGDSILVRKCEEFKEGVIDLNDTPDLGPALFALAACSNKRIVFTNTKRLRIKESDRVEAMVSNLRKLNCKVRVYSNKVIFYPSKLEKTNEVLNSYNDHRIVMALAMLGSVIGDLRIENPLAVNKSYPLFFEDIKKIGIEVEFND